MSMFSPLRLACLVLVGCFGVASGRAQAQASNGAQPTASVVARSKALATLFDEIWQDRLKTFA